MNDFRTIFPEFDKFLADKKLYFEAIVIGGVAMQLLGLTERVTKDCDVLTPIISIELKQASNNFARQRGLPENWLNNGPHRLVNELPPGWQTSIVVLYEGNNLKLYTLSRLDLLRSKLYAFLDRGIDMGDLKKLMPTKSEIDLVRDWLSERDGNPDWQKYVDIRLAELITELYGDP